MSYIIVTSNTRGVIFDVGVYSTALGFNKFFRDKATVQTVSLKDEWIEYTTLDGKTFAVAHQLIPQYPNVLKVDSVSGVTASSLSQLFDLFVDILD